MSRTPEFVDRLLMRDCVPEISSFGVGPASAVRKRLLATGILRRANVSPPVRGRVPIPMVIKCRPVQNCMRLQSIRYDRAP